MSTIADRVKTAKHREYLANPKVQAMLKTIRYAEGTSGEDGYRTRVGGSKFNDYSRKPGEKTYIKSIDSFSTAEGAYQFLNKTWDGASKRLGLSDFSPESQDIAAVDLIINRGAMDNILDNDFEGAINKLSPEWASLPKKDGSGYYSGQKARSMENLYKIYSDGKTMSRPKTSFTNFEMEENRGNLATVPDVEEKPEVAEAIKTLDSKQNEENFLKAMFSKQNEDFTVAEPKKIVPQQIAPTNIMETYDKINNFVEAQQGGVIEDNQGQWAYPGDVTKIDGGNITMKGVNYPVLGVSDKGEQQMMYPNKNYQFQGAESVTEYPQLTEKEKNFLKAVQNYKNRK